ncbi:acyltransferase [Methylobacter sp.]|uniref:acyltransferase n=1 Tax=Methylobacter sp. TaxID=2051955 RepID=UPI002FDCAD60
MKKIVLAALISAMPLAGLRRWFYRVLMGYEIPASSKTGFLTVIAVSGFQLGEQVNIGMLNLFKGPIEVRIGDSARIGKCNRFTCSWHITHDRFKDRHYTPRLMLGARSLVLDEHFFDVYGEISIGEGSWIAGHGSQFWTHGLSVEDRDIQIGDNNYIGSAVRFSPGTSIGNNNIVALGSVVLSKLVCDSSLVSGFPAKPFRSIEEDLKKGKYRFSFEDWKD